MIVSQYLNVVQDLVAEEGHLAFQNGFFVNWNRFLQK